MKLSGQVAIVTGGGSGQGQGHRSAFRARRSEGRRRRH